MTTAQKLREALGKTTQGEWEQGQLLTTRQTRSWSQAKKLHGDREEKRRLFVNFSNLDEGRSREFVGEFFNAENAEGIAIIHNLLPAFLDSFEMGLQITRALSERNEELIKENMKLEREAAAGRALAEAVAEIEDEGCRKGHYPEDCYCDVESMNRQRNEALAAYHTACGKGDGV